MIRLRIKNLTSGEASEMIEVGFYNGDVRTLSTYDRTVIEIDAIVQELHHLVETIESLPTYKKYARKMRRSK